MLNAQIYRYRPHQYTTGRLNPGARGTTADVVSARLKSLTILAALKPWLPPPCALIRLQGHCVPGKDGATRTIELASLVPTITRHLFCIGSSRANPFKHDLQGQRPPGTALTSDRERRNWHDARMRTARGAGGGRRALQQDMEQFTAISTLRGIMFPRRGIMYLLRGNMYHVHQLFITSRKCSF